MMIDPVKQLEKKFFELLSTEVAMQKFLNNEAFAGIWFWDLHDRGTIWLSNSLEKLLGFEENQHLKIPLSWNELLPVDRIDTICNSFDTYLASDTESQFEMQIPFLQKNSRVHYLKCRAIAVNNKSYLLGLIQVQHKSEEIRTDHITEFPFTRNSIELEQEIPLKNLAVDINDDHEFASKYESLINAGNLGGWEYKVDNGDLWCSKEYFELLGYDTSSIKSWEKYETQKVWVDLLHPEDKENARAYFTNYLKHLKGIYRQEFRMKHADGNWIWVSSRGKVMSEIVDGVKTKIVIGTHTDISESKRLEKKLFESNTLMLKDNALLNSIINSPDNIIIISIDMEYRYTSFTNNYRKFVKEKFGKDIYIGYKLIDIFSESQLTIFKPKIDAALSGEHCELSVSIPIDSNKLLYVNNKYNPIQDEYGKIIGATVFIHDITSEKNSEIENKMNELRYSSLFYGASDAIFIANAATGFLVDVNLKAIELTGYEKSELLSMHQTQLHPPEILLEIESIFKKFSSAKGFISIESLVLSKNGKLIPVQITAGSTFQIGEETFVAGYFKDISSRVRITEELKIHSQHLKDIAWTQSHMLRAPLTRLMGLVNALHRGIVPEEEKSMYLNYVKEASNELDDVIRDITANTIIN